MSDNFDLQGWMRENKQGAYGHKIFQKKGKKSLKEAAIAGGMVTFGGVNSLKEDYEDEMDEIKQGMSIAQKWEKIPVERKEEMLDSLDDDGEGLADYAYMGWAMVPEPIQNAISLYVSKEPVQADDEDEDEKIAAIAAKNAKKGAKMVKGLNPDKDIYDILHGDDEDIY